MQETNNVHGIFKQLAFDNHYTSLAKTVSSEISSRETAKTIKCITHSNIPYAHMGQLVIKDGMCYASFLQNTGDDNEQTYSKTGTVVMSIFSLEKIQSDDFVPDRDVKVIPIGRMGDIFAGRTATSIFKDNSMCLIGEKIHITFTFECDDGKAHMFSEVYNISTGTFTDQCEIKLIYNGKEYDFTDETLNIVYADKGLPPKAKSLIELVSRWSEYKGEYYATGIAIGDENAGFIVKTKDFKTMTLVDVPPFNEHGGAEIASYIQGDKLYVACRQAYGRPYLLFSAYDLVERKWARESRIPDGNCRPWFFTLRSQLYMLNTVEEHWRRFTNVSRVIQLPYLKDRAYVECVATLADCGRYYATCEYEGHIFYVCSLGGLKFGELKLTLAEPEEINRKLTELLGY